MSEALEIDSKRQTFVGAHDNRLIGDVFPASGSMSQTHGPILLMHGGGQTRHSWLGTAKLLAEQGHTAIAVDARGHGDSDWVADKAYALPQYAADLACLSEQLSDQFGARPVVVGASMGGLSAMLCFENGRGNELFSKVILVDITPRMEQSGVNKILSFMASNMRDGFESPQQAADAISAYLPNRKKPESLDGLRKNLRRRDDGRYIWHWDPAFVDGPLSIMSGPENPQEILSSAIAKIEVPTLLVRGSKSELVKDEAVKEFMEIVPHAKFVDVNDAGHMVAGDKNDAFASSVIDFLNAP